MYYLLVPHSGTGDLLNTRPRVPNTTFFITMNQYDVFFSDSQQYCAKEGTFYYCKKETDIWSHRITYNIGRVREEVKKINTSLCHKSMLVKFVFCCCDRKLSHFLWLITESHFETVCAYMFLTCPSPTFAFVTSASQSGSSGMFFLWWIRNIWKNFGHFHLRFLAVIIWHTACNTCLLLDSLQVVLFTPLLLQYLTWPPASFSPPGVKGIHL